MTGAFVPEINLRCADCGAHYQLAPDGSIQDAACENCGGQRFFRTQPNPVQSDGTMRDMVDSDTQKDEGGNPLGTGVIMGDDGERPRGKRDNYMHGKVAESVFKPADTLDQEPYDVWWADLKTATRHEALGPIINNPDPAHNPQGQNDLSEVYQMTHPDQSPNTNPYGAPHYPDAAQALGQDALPFLGEALPAAGAALGVGGGGGAAAGEAAAGDAGAAGGAATGEAESAGTGGLSGLAKGIGSKIAPRLMTYALGHEAMKALGDLGSSGNMQYDQAPSAQALSSFNDPLMVLADAWDGARGENTVIDNDDNPEKQDQKEFNDKDKSPSNFHNPNLQDSGKSGEDDAHSTEDLGAFSPDSPGVERLMMMLPLLMHWATQEESGMGDPMVRALHEQLETEKPGYLEHGKKEHPGVDHALEILVNAHGGHGPKQANTVGPNTPEQIAAVQQYLMTQGKDDLVPDVPLHPENYAHILNEIQHQPNTAPLVDPSQATPPPAPMQPMPGGAPGGMPVVDPTQAGGGGMPMQPMANTLEILADANNAVARCPECGSASTRVDTMSESSPDDPMAYCPSCGNHFKPKTGAAPQDLSAQDMPAPGEGNPSMVWSDAHGAPLSVGSEYQLYAPGYDVGDEVMVLYKKPNELGLKLSDDFADIQYQDATPDLRITPQQMQQHHYVFVPVGGSTEQGGGTPGQESPEMTTDEATNAFPNRGTALSSNESSRDWLREGGFATEEIAVDPETMARVAGKKFTLQEQKELINERGAARNLQDLDLSHTHYLDVDDDAFALGF